MMHTLVKMTHTEFTNDTPWRVPVVQRCNKLGTLL
jgi:hypothetical protein